MDMVIAVIMYQKPGTMERTLSNCIFCQRKKNQTQMSFLEKKQ